MSATYEKLVDLLVTHFAVEREKIRPDATFEELDLDSLFLVELLLVLQTELDMELADDAVNRTDTFGHLAELVEGRLGVTP
ncbi:MULTISPECIES: acyl carrier protein [unclassified Streptomyces]|uniref:acyl carrier protein n=1 Tax=unclassified Streptomyces TaxID=2593676 RepID=UPI000B324D20|nr:MULTISPECIES: phosphopantetheine-binding protein [unclassified Streptomyces]AZM60899.1 acyl carrier protein [Streptomyces sp. WAC 01438]RSM94534.1 acyl carrier protein [Streptomyces sp. WAC 01420]